MSQAQSSEQVEHLGYRSVGLYDVGAWIHVGGHVLKKWQSERVRTASMGNVSTVKPVCNDHLYNTIYYLWFIQQCVLMKTEGTNLLLLKISAL